MRTSSFDTPSYRIIFLGVIGKLAHNLREIDLHGSLPYLIFTPPFPPIILSLPDIPNHADDGFSSTALGSVIATFITLLGIDSKCPLHSRRGGPTPGTCQSIPTHIQFELYPPFLSAIDKQMDPSTP